jgi:hypothetical protein
MNRSKWLYMPVMAGHLILLITTWSGFFFSKFQNQRNTSSRFWGENQIYKLPDLVISKSSKNLWFSWSLEVILDCRNVKPPSVQLICHHVPNPWPSSYRVHFQTMWCEKILNPTHPARFKPLNVLIPLASTTLHHPWIPMVG